MGFADRFPYSPKAVSNGDVTEDGDHDGTVAHWLLFTRA